MSNQSKIAVVLFNLGGPDKLESVKPFLFNLFNDKAIIPWPQPFRGMLARLISTLRSEKSKKIYERLGGKSPILDYTFEQARALETWLDHKLSTSDVKVFIVMRYWHPLTEDVVKQVKEFGATQVVLLPLYPQFSTTTTASSFLEWRNKAKKLNLIAFTSSVCCYFNEENFLQSHLEIITPFWKKAKQFGNPRILFSAHGIPQKCIDKGDPYQWQVEQTVAQLVKKFTEAHKEEPDYRICYQSKVGPAKWLEPNIDYEIEQAAKDGKPILLVPIAFVSEHSETLVELDMDYKTKAEKLSISFYGRVPTLNAHEMYIKSLGTLVLSQINGTWVPPGCPVTFNQCPCNQNIL